MNCKGLTGRDDDNTLVDGGLHRMHKRQFTRRAVGLGAVFVLLLMTASASAVTITGFFETEGSTDLTEGLPVNLDSTLGLQLDKDHGAGAFHAGLHIHQSLGSDSGATWDWVLDALYADYYADDFDLRIGKQRLSWGTAMQINPMDVVNPMNPHDPLGDKQSTWAALLDYYVGWNYKISAAVVPAFSSQIRPHVPHPVTGEPLTINDPDLQLNNVQGAIRGEAQGLSGWDVSVMYYYGREQRPGLRQTPNMDQGTLPSSMQDLALEYPRTHVFGTAIAGTLGDAAVWAEGAYHFPEFGDSYWHWIVGGDYGFGNGVLAVAQYYQRWQDGDLQHQLIGALEKDFVQLHTARLGAMYRLDTGSWMLRPEIEWSLADAIRLNTGVQWLEEKADHPANALPLHQPDSLRLYVQFRMDF